MPAIEVKNLRKTFKLPHEQHSTLKQTLINFHRRSFEELEALRDISFEVKKGEFFGIVGRNGSGKSTLLKILAGIYAPTAGEVAVHGKITPFIELGVGFNPELTGHDNIYLNGALLGMTKKQIQDKYEDIVAFSELEKFLDQKLKNYSSGMQVRLAFSIAIHAQTGILLIDEVLAVGDANFQRKCFNIFKKFKKDKRTVVFISHDMESIREYCDRAILINDGKILSEGKPNSVANDYLQLLSKEDSAKAKTPGGEEDKDRWGDGKARISNVKVKTSKDVIRVSYKCQAKERIKDPIFGMIIKDKAGNKIIDSNTKWNKIRTGVLDKGEIVEVSWDIPNILKAGDYEIAAAAAHSDGLSFYDWREAVKEFRVNKTKLTGGMVLVDTEIEINKE